MELAAEKLSVSFGNWALRDFSAKFADGSFTSVVGPSGCGKTTVLRLLAGLEKPSSGKVFLGGRDFTSSSPEERGLGLVFHGDSLFHHMNVFENVAFGLSVRGLSKANVLQKVSEALAAVKLSGFEGRLPDSLSGGESKRAAIARAIAFSPNALLLDEPFNGLDANLKEEMKLLLKNLQRSSGITTIMVTHDIGDAFFLSDRIIVMGNGFVSQDGAPPEIFLKPKNDFVKGFISGYSLAKARKSGNSFGAKIPSKAISGKGDYFLCIKNTDLRKIE